eukprot:5907864-Amphidinium_carterae.1
MDAADSLIEVLLLAHMSGQTMTAKLLTTICHYAAEAGIEKCQPLAMDPGKLGEQSGGNAKKKIDRYVGKNKSDQLPCGFYTLSMPALLSSTKERGQYPFKMLCPHR